MGDLGSLRAVHRVFQRSSIPEVLALPGWHDTNYDELVDKGEPPWTRNWEQVMGPTYYSVDRGLWHLILYPDEDNRFGEEAATMKRRWLAADLKAAAGKHILLAQHTAPDGEWLDYLADRGVEVVIFGHWHSSKCYRHGPILVLATPPLLFGGIDTTPRGFRLMALGSGEPETRFAPLCSVRRSKRKTRSGIALLWEAKAGTNLHRGEPLADQGQVLIPVPDEEYRGRAGVLSLCSDDGSRQWFAPTTGSVRGNLAANEACVFAVTQPGELIALDRVSGDTVWSHKLMDFPERWVYNGPAVSHGVVIAGTGTGGIQALDVATGTERWRWRNGKWTSDIWAHPKDERTNNTWAHDQWPHYHTPVAVGTSVVVGLAWPPSGVVSLSIEDGQVLWAFDCEYGYALAGMLATEQALLVPSLPDQLHALDPATGDLLWTGHTGSGGVVAWNASDSLLVLNTEEGWTQARCLSDGEFVWRFRHGPDLLDMLPYQQAGCSAVARPVLIDSAVLVAGLDGWVCLLHLETGRTRAACNLGQAIVAATAGPDGAAILTTWEGRIFYVQIDGG